MAFSVLLSLYAKEKAFFLRQSLGSVFSQTLIPDEVVLVLDGPITNELRVVVNEFCELYPSLKIVTLSKNQGLGTALNVGLAHCNNELVVRMDTDDISYPDRFEKQVAFMQKHPECSISSGWISEFIGDKDNVISIKKLPETHEELYQYGKNRCPINHPASIFRKSAVEKAGGYKHLYLFEDYYLWGRMMMNGARFANIQEPLLYFRSSPDMMKRRGGLKYALAEVRLQKKFYDIGYISFLNMAKNVTIRFSVRIMPLKIRTFVYNHLLRR